jgi:hypothetical protein
VGYVFEDYGFGFEINYQLQIEKKEQSVVIKNDFADYKYAWMSCNLEDSYVEISVEWEGLEESDNLVDYLKKNWRATGENLADEYLVDEFAYWSMIGPIQKMKIGEMDVVEIFAGEARHVRYAFELGERVYLVTVWTGGETGTVPGEFPRKVAQDMIATFREIDK